MMLVRGQFAICVFALHALARSSAAGFQAPHHEPPQSVDSGLQVPSAPLVVSGAATSLATESVESGVVEPSASVAESFTAATGSATGSAAHPPSTSQSDGQKVRAKPSRPDTLRKAKQPHVLKEVTIAQWVEKYGKYGLYDNNGRLYCKPRGKKMDETPEDSLTLPQVFTMLCAPNIFSLFFPLPLIVLQGNQSAYCWCSAGQGANRPACIR